MHCEARGNIIRNIETKQWFLSQEKRETVRTRGMCNEVDRPNKAVTEVITMLTKEKKAQGLYESEVMVG